MADWVTNQCTEDGYIDKQNAAPLRSWACLYGKGKFNPDETGLSIQGEASWCPGLFLAQMVANHFPSFASKSGDRTNVGHPSGGSYGGVRIAFWSSRIPSTSTRSGSTIMKSRMDSSYHARNECNVSMSSSLGVSLNQRICRPAPPNDPPRNGRNTSESSYTICCPHSSVKNIFVRFPNTSKEKVMKIEVPVWPGWQKPQFDDPRMPVVKAVNIYDHKDGECLGYVFDDVGHVHFAIQLGRAVIACEHIPENYPATTIAFYKCRRDWIDAVRSVEWIVNGLRAEAVMCSPECPKEFLEQGTAATSVAADGDAAIKPKG